MVPRRGSRVWFSSSHSRVYVLTAGRRDLQQQGDLDIGQAAALLVGLGEYPCDRLFLDRAQFLAVLALAGLGSQDQVEHHAGQLGLAHAFAIGVLLVFVDGHPRRLPGTQVRARRVEALDHLYDRLHQDLAGSLPPELGAFAAEEGVQGPGEALELLGAIGGLLLGEAFAHGRSWRRLTSAAAKQIPFFGLRR